MTVNDDKKNYLQSVTGEVGTVNDLMLKWLKQLGVTSSNLNDAWKEYLDEQGVSPGVPNERLVKWLKMLGYSGSNINEGMSSLWSGSIRALGPELVVSGGFDTDSGWNKGAGWTISGGKLNAATSTTASTTQTSVTDGESIHVVIYTISNYVSGGVRLRLGGGSGTIRTSNGTFTEKITASVNEIVEVDPVTSFEGSIDNVSVREEISG